MIIEIGSIKGTTGASPVLQYVITHPHPLPTSLTGLSNKVVGQTGAVVSVADDGPRGPWFET